MAETAGRLNPSPESWVRRYPPIAVLAVATLIAALVLPSSLNLPNSNPTVVLEYAPVPPDDDTPPDDSGNLSTLGLGSSSSLSTGVVQKKVETQKEGGKGKKAVTKRCVGKPLRQTEDPNSPPCVPFFEGDNGGQTWQGVNENEIVALIYHSASSRGSESTPTGQYCDVDLAPDSDPGCRNSNGSLEDLSRVTAARALSRYFNERFQTYDRHVHFYIYWSGASTAAARRAEAVANWERLKPFAVIDAAFFGGFNEAYAETITKRRVNIYGSFVGQPNSFYRKFAPQLWSFWPDIEHAADMFTSYVCTRAAPYPVSHSGMAEDIGQARRYGLLYTTDPEFPGHQYYAELVKRGIQQCPNGAKVDIVSERTYSRNQYQTDASADSRREAIENIAAFRDAKVTTILWPQGYETAHSERAFTDAWFPEWIVAGDGLNDGIANGRGQQQDVWKHAWGISNFLNEAQPEARPCVQAYREADPSGPSLTELDACVFYRDMFTLFKSIQLAGPELTPESVDKGHHAIPRYSSTDPRIAACFYDPGDYTCVKDAMEIWWDSDASDPEGAVDERGCWRMTYGGRRFLAGAWPAGDDAFRDRADPCNTVDTRTFLGTAADD